MRRYLFQDETCVCGFCGRSVSIVRDLSTNALKISRHFLARGFCPDSLIDR